MAVKDATEHRIDDVTKLLRNEARSEQPDMDKIARLEKELAADTKAYADIVAKEIDAEIELKKLELETLRNECEMERLKLTERLETSKIELESERLELEKASVEVQNVKNEVEDLKSRRQWAQDMIRNAVMLLTGILAVVLPIWFDRYKEQQLNARFLLSQNTEEKVPYLTVTDKEAVRQGLANNTGRGKITLPWK